MGYMPDFFGVYDRLKTWEYLYFYARCYGFGTKERGHKMCIRDRCYDVRADLIGEAYSADSYRRRLDAEGVECIMETVSYTHLQSRHRTHHRCPGQRGWR